MINGPLSIIGADAVQQTGSRRGWSKDKGRTSTKIFTGPNDKLETFFEANEDNSTIDEITFDNSAGRARVEILTVDENPSGGGQATQELNEIWEVIGQDLWKNLRAHQEYNKDDDQNLLEEVRKNFEEARPPLTGLVTPESTYQALLNRGVEEYARSAVILQNTVRVSSRSVLAGSWVSVDRAVKFQGEPGSPNPPSTIIGTIANMPEFESDKKQWLKRAPMIRQIERRRFEIVTIWWFARRWSNILYEGDLEDGNP